MEHLLFSIPYYVSLRVLSSYEAVTVKFTNDLYSNINWITVQQIALSLHVSLGQLSPNYAVQQNHKDYLLKVQNPNSRLWTYWIQVTGVQEYF